jgi:oligosaccharide repeat unit polymerase
LAATVRPEAAGLAAMIDLEKTLAIVFSVTILAHAAFLKRVVGTWLFPGCLFGLFWHVFTIVPLLLLPAAPINPWSVAYILLASVSFSAGSLIFPWSRALRMNARRVMELGSEVNVSFLQQALSVISIASILGIIENSLVQGIGFADFTTDIIGSAARYARLRSAQDVVPNLYGQVGLLLAYVAASVGGLLQSTVSTRRERVAATTMALLPAVIALVLQSAKGPLFLSIALFYGGTLLGKVRNARMEILSKRALLPVLLYGGILLGLVGLSFLSRGLYGTSLPIPELVSQLIPFFASYFFGHVYAFSDWFSFVVGLPYQQAYLAEGPTYGFYTFMVLFKALGSNKVASQGIFSELYVYKDILGTNIYTMFRPMVTDFGLAGCLIFVGILGMVSHLSFYFLILVRRPVVSAALFVFMVGCLVHSYLGSLLMYGSFYGSLGLFILVLLAEARTAVGRIGAGGGRESARTDGMPSRRRARTPRPGRHRTIEGAHSHGVAQNRKASAFGQLSDGPSRVS